MDKNSDIDESDTEHTNPSEDDDENCVYYEEESSESEPELECDRWDNDCRVISDSHDIKTVLGYHLLPTCDRDPETLPKKKLKLSFQINSNITKRTFTSCFKNNYSANKHYKDPFMELVTDPFKVCVFNNFLENGTLLDEIRREFYEMDFNIRSMDLYEFFQSKDLKYLQSEYVKMVYDFLKTDVKTWVAELTGYKLTNISATCSVYTNTDYLLVHDDQREDRLVAFILYLTGPEDWHARKGGALQLLSKDCAGQPKEIVRDIFPANNQLVFFPVTNDSYHQVAEITSLSDCRLSINGWFHTTPAPEFITPIYKPLQNGLYGKQTLKPIEMDVELETWIRSDYLESNAIKLIQKYVEENSEISLKDFFNNNSFNEVQSNIKSKDLTWIKVGPPNRYSYEILDTQSLPFTLERFLNLFKSNQMFSLLQKYTDLDLTTERASMKFEVQKWTPGCYSLLTDYGWQEKNELDLILYFNCPKRTDVIGARTQYVTNEDEIQNALITIEPEDNNLNIVYRDSARFTKYFSKQSKCECFYVLICSYAE